MDGLRRLGALCAVIALTLAFAVNAAAQGEARRARLASPAEGEIVEGPNVTFRVEHSGIRLPEEHFHVLLDAAALEYVAGNPIPIGRVEMVHFRAASTTVRMTAGTHFVVLISTNNDHLPLRPWTGESRFFFVK